MAFIIENLVGNIVVSRTTEGLLVQVKGHAHTELECVYCLDDFQHNLSFDFVEMYTFPSHAVEDTELILPDDLQIDLAPLLTSICTWIFQLTQCASQIARVCAQFVVRN